MALSLVPSIDERISDWIESKRRDQIEHRESSAARLIRWPST
jgi:hypothetical protein